MDSQTKTKMEYLGTLIARSALPDDIKKTIFDNLEKFTEHHVDMIIASLEREQAELLALSEKMETFDETQAKSWQQLEVDQEKKARELLSDFFKDVDAQVASSVAKS